MQSAEVGVIYSLTAQQSSEHKFEIICTVPFTIFFKKDIKPFSLMDKSSSTEASALPCADNE